MLERQSRKIVGSATGIAIVCSLLQTTTMRSQVLALVVRHHGHFFASRVPKFAAVANIQQRAASSYKRYDALFASAPPDFSIDDDDDDVTEEKGMVPGVDLSKEHKQFTPDDDDDDNEIDTFPLSKTSKTGTSKTIPTKRSSIPPRAPKPPKRKAGIGVRGTSWMDKNVDGNWKKEEEPPVVAAKVEEKKVKHNQKPKESGANDTNSSFKEDFRGTRVFVQNVPPSASWQDLKDHFRVAGEVVFASISVDTVTGESKGCGIVQFETFNEAKTAIKIMRDHPLDGAALYVREDVQDKPAMPRGGGNTTLPTKWKCANEENEGHLSVDERTSILSLIRARDQARRRKNYAASDDMREELKLEYGVHVDDRLKMWWTSVDGKTVPTSVSEIKGEGGWSGPKPWRQIPTTPENDACVSSDLVEGLLKQRDIARREKDFATADTLLNRARDSPDGSLYLRIHDESRTYRIWTDAKPPREFNSEYGNTATRSYQDMSRKAPKSVSEQCMDIVEKHEPAKAGEVRNVLAKFPGREYNILKKLRQRYTSNDE